MLTRHEVEASRARADAATKSPWQWVDPDNDARADLPAALDALEEVMEAVRSTLRQLEEDEGIVVSSLQRLLAAYDADAEGMQRR